MLQELCYFSLHQQNLRPILQFSNTEIPMVILIINRYFAPHGIRSLFSEKAPQFQGPVLITPYTSQPLNFSDTPHNFAVNDFAKKERRELLTSAKPYF